MSKYKDFDDDYEYDDEEDFEYTPVKRNKKNSRNQSSTKSSVNAGNTRNVQQGHYQQQRQPEERAHSGKKKKKKMKRSTMVIILVLEVLLLAILMFVWYVLGKMDMIHYTPIDRDVIHVNPDIKEDTKEVLEGYTNILLLGTDARDNSEITDQKFVNHTDSIIVASINNKTKEVRLLSVYRDTLLKMMDVTGNKEVRYDKATEAGFYYGVESTINMINTNMDMDISDYVMVNWSALIDIVDAVGGIDIEINDTEKYWINSYLTETGPCTGHDYSFVENTGLVHLDGVQATSYCRIRYGGGDDYRRTERQRTVITKVLEKAKKMDLNQLDKAITAIFQNVSTSLDMGDIINLAKDVAEYNIGESAGFPFDKQTNPQVVINNNGSVTTDMVIPVDLAGNVSQAHKFLFDVEGYSPSDTVKEISNKIVELTGIK